MAGVGGHGRKLRAFRFIAAARLCTEGVREGDEMEKNRLAHTDLTAGDGRCQQDGR